MKTTLRAAAAFLTIMLAPRVLRADEWAPARLWVVGSDQSTWIVGASEAKGPSLGVVHMWHAGPKDEPSAARQNYHLPPVSGTPLCVGADAEALRVLFSDLTAYDYFGNRPYSPDAVWKDECRGRPLAWAGDATLGVFWALVETEDLVTPATQAGSDEETTQPDGPTPDDSRLTVLQLRSGVWHRLKPHPAASEGRAFWIASRDGAVSLFWSAGDNVLVSSRRDTSWSAPKVVSAREQVRQGWAGATADGLVFVAGRRTGAGLYQLDLFLEQHGAWTPAGSAREGNEFLTLDARVCGVGIVRGQLGIARPARNGEVEFGVAPLGTSPALRFSTLSTRRDELTTRPPWEDTITLALLLGIMTLALWSRREEAARTLDLPQGLAPAAVWKRLAATAIDLLPAFLLIAPWWLPKMQAFSLEHGTDLSAELRDLLAQQLRLESYATFLAYGLWCFFWEALMGRTPGKMAFRCRVIGTDGAPARVRPCLIRNAVRVLMVSLGIPGLVVTLMTILIVTRNRQRIGDLLARTVVVEPASPTEEDAGPPEDDSRGPFD
jgi:uncharacterized RDD family membrane protein YckC